MSSLRRGHANLLCIVPILTDDPRRESECNVRPKSIVSARSTSNRPWLALPLAVSMRSIGMPSLPVMVRFSCFENLLCQVELFIRVSACAHVYAWLSLCCCVGQHTNTARTHTAQHNATQRNTTQHNTRHSTRLIVGSCSEADYLKRNSAMDDSIGGS